MELRQMLDKNKPAVVAVVVIAVLVAGYVAYRQTAGVYVGTGQPGFYSDDDGRTWFVEGIGRLPPFDHNGKQAVRCYLYECDSGKFVAYLERYRPDYLKEHAKLDDPSKPLSTNDRQALLSKLSGMGDACREVKKPGAGDWVVRGNPAFIEVVVPKCPDGSRAQLVRP